MARYVYEASKVNTSIDYLNSAVNILQPTEAALAAGFNQLAQVQGGNLIDVGQNQSVICSLPSEAQTYISDLRKAIEGKRSEIEEFNKAPWYKKLFASIGMGVAKFGEGFITAFENIGDAGVSLVGFVGGIFNKDFQNSCAEFIKRDLGGEFASNLYKEGTFIGTYSAISTTGFVSNVCKGFGTAMGYYAMGRMAGGLNTIVGNPLGIGSVGVNSFVAGAGGLGSGTETALLRGSSYDEAFFQGVKTGVIQGSLAYAAGRLGDKIKRDKEALKAGTSTETGSVAENTVAGDKIAETGQSGGSSGGKGKKFTTSKETLESVDKTHKSVSEATKKAITKTADIVDDLDSTATKKTLKLNKTASKSYGKMTGSKSPELNNIGDNLMESISTSAQSVDKSGTYLSKLKNKGNILEEGSNVVEQTIEKADGALINNTRNTISGTQKLTGASSTKIPSIPSGAASGSSAATGSLGSNLTRTAISKTDKALNLVSSVVTNHPVATSNTVKAAYLGAVVKSTSDNTAARAAITPIAKINTTTTQNKVDSTPVIKSNPTYNATTNTVSKTTPSIQTITTIQNQSKISATPTTTTASTTPKTIPSTSQVATTTPTHNTNSGGTRTFGGTTTTTTTPATTTSKPSLATSVASSITNKTKTAETLTQTESNSSKFDHPASTTSTTGSNTHNDYTGLSNYQIPSGSTTAVTGGTKYPAIKSQVEGSVAKNNISTTTLGSSGSTHAGGGYSGSGYSFGGSSAVTSDGSIGIQDTKGTLASSVTKTKSDKSDTSRIAIAEEVEEDVETTANNYVVPTSAALSAAAAAGIGAKIVMDKKEKDKEKEKEENDSSEEYDYDFGSELKDIDELDDDFTIIESY